MPVTSFDCPNCGAPLDYKNTGETTMRCPYCETSVVVPEEVRGESIRPASVQIFTVEQKVSAPLPKSGLSKGCVITLVILILLFAALMTALPFLLTDQVSSQISNQFNEVFQITSAATLAQAFEITMQPSVTPTPPKPTPTPGFMVAKMQFGEKGIAEGMLNNAQFMAIDGNGVIYVADRDGGRIQAFELEREILESLACWG